MELQSIYLELDSLLKQKNFKSAKNKISKYLEKFKNHPGLLEMLAISHQGLNEIESSIATYLKLLSVNPKSISANLNLARLYSSTKNIKEADFYYLETKKLDQNIVLEMEHGLFLTKHNLINRALKVFNHCLSLDPNNFLVYYEIGNVFLKDKKFINAINYFKQSIEKKNNFYKSYNNLALAYNNLGKTKEAKEIFKKSIEVDPNIYLTYSNLGLVHQSEGNFEEAIKNFNKALSLNLNDGETHRYLSVSKKYLKGDPHINQMIDLLKNTKDKNNRISLNFALSKASEDIGEFEMSAQYLNEGNSLQRSKFKNFSIQEIEKQFSILAKYFSYNFVNSDIEFTKKFTSYTPIFIVGLPRSGTTLTEQILSNHSNVYGCGEINDLTEAINIVFPDTDTKKMLNSIINSKDDCFKQLGENYLTRLAQKTNKKYITDKMPFNFKVIGLIKKSIPNAKIIHCFRNPNDNLLSIYKNFFNQDLMPWAYDKNELRLYYHAYNKLMEHYKIILNDYIFDLSYEELTSNPTKTVENLLNFCNLPWEDNCVNIEKNNRPIFTASVSQARNKINTKSIESWKKFQQYLPELFIGN